MQDNQFCAQYKSFISGFYLVVWPGIGRCKMRVDALGRVIITALEANGFWEVCYRKNGRLVVRREVIFAKLCLSWQALQRRGADLGGETVGNVDSGSPTARTARP